MKRFCLALMPCFFLSGFLLLLHAQDPCELTPDAHRRPEEAPPKMGQYQLQEIYLGMSFKEFQLIKPNVSARPIVEGGVIHEYSVEHFTADEQFLLIFTFDGRLYKLIYQKEFEAAVSEQELQIKLTQKYGIPDQLVEKPRVNKVFEACWGQCQMIREGIFCQNENTDIWYTYFTAGLSITRKQFFVVLNDSALYERNEIGFAERKRTRQMTPATTALNRLQL